MKPATVPNVDQPNNGGNETKKTHSQSTKATRGDFSHLSATGPSQMNTLPVKTRKPMPDAPTNKDAT